MKTRTKTISAFIFILLIGISLASALTINSVSTSPDEVAPGEISKIRIEIVNNGDETVTDVSVSLDLSIVPFAPFDSSSEFSIDEIKKDRTKQADFEISALNDAKSGNYKIPVKISYTENGVLNTRQSLISLLVNSEPIIEASVEDGLLLKGQKNAITIKVVNKGLADVKFLEIEVGNSGSYTLLSPKKVYIGDIDSNDFDSAEFQIFFKETSPDKVNLLITVKYKDVTGKEYIYDDSLESKVYSQEQAISLGLITKSNTSTIIIVIVVIIVIFFIYRKIRNRRKKVE